MRFTVVTASGASVAWQLTGEPNSKPVRVYLAGLGAAATVAFPPALADARLATEGQHLLVDLVGSGWSDSDDSFDYTVDEHAGTVISVLETLSLAPVELVGHSLGGSIAISLAAQRPSLVERLVVIEPNLDPGVGSTSAEIAGQTEEEFVRSGYPILLADILRQGEEGDMVMAEWARTMRRWSARGLHRTAVSLLADRPRTFREQLAAFDGPRRYISGELSRESLEPLRSIGCDVRVVEDAGHDVMADNLDGFIRALL
jgi:pimeloyl-ACP methyl ester carboxylesterase